MAEIMKATEPAMFSQVFHQFLASGSQSDSRWVVALTARTEATMRARIEPTKSGRHPFELKVPGSATLRSAARVDVEGKGPDELDRGGPPVVHASFDDEPPFCQRPVRRSWVKPAIVKKIDQGSR